MSTAHDRRFICLKFDSSLNIFAMQSKGKHGRLSQAIPISKVQTFSCGIFGVCSPVLLSPRTPPFQVLSSSHDFFPSDILLIQRNSTEERCGKAQEACSGTDTPNFFSLNIITCSSTASAPNSPLERSSARGREFCEFQLSTQSSPRELSDDQCLENLLAKVRKGCCTRSGLKTLLRLVGERKCGNVRALEEQVASALISLLTSSSSDESFRHTAPFQEAFAAIVRLLHNEVILRWSAKPDMLGVVDWILNRGNLDARVNAAILLQKISSNEDLEKTITDRQSLLDGIVRLVLKSEQPNAAKFALRALLAFCLSAENRCGAVRAGSVAAIMKILPGARITTAEKALAILELLGTTSEGRAAMSDHELVVPVLVNMILKISDRATEYAAGVLCAICTPDTHRIQERAVHAGVQTRLLLLLQSHCTERAKRKALQLLKVLHRFWDQQPRLSDSGRTEKIHY